MRGHGPSDLTRRELLRLAAAAGSAVLVGLPAPSLGSPTPHVGLGIPGPYPGRVIEVQHPLATGPDYAVIDAMVGRGMRALTGAPDATAAWRRFFEPGDVVGLKVNPVGRALASTNFALVQAVVTGLQSAGVRAPDIVVFDRYRKEFVDAGFPDHLPADVRWDAACADYDEVQLDLDGYDRDVFRELDLVGGDQDPKDDRVRRSHVCRIVSQQVNKIVNLPVLKDHAAAGVTLALKNLSHGLVNNVRRSHFPAERNAVGIFIPAIVSLPVIRSKVVLNVLDGTRAVFDGGPGASKRRVWSQRTLYFATDPVALDHVGWEAIDAKRRELGLPPVADARFEVRNETGVVLQSGPRQPEHIRLAAAAGLGVFASDQLQHQRIALG